MEQVSIEENKILSSELLVVGVKVRSVYDLINTPQAYPDAIPILLKWLPQVKSISIKEGIVRALTVKYAGKEAVTALIDEFTKTDSSSSSNLILKWTIGNAISVIGYIDDVFDIVVNLTKDVNHGKAREMLVVALGNSKRPEAKEVLIQLLKDDELCGFAVSALRKIGSSDTIPYIEPFLTHPKAWIRKEANKTISKIRKDIMQ